MVDEFELLQAVTLTPVVADEEVELGVELVEEVKLGKNC